MAEQGEVRFEIVKPLKVHVPSGYGRSAPGRSAPNAVVPPRFLGRAHSANCAYCGCGRRSTVIDR